MELVMEEWFFFNAIVVALRLGSSHRDAEGKEADGARRMEMLEEGLVSGRYDGSRGRH
jgi:hypothetical protein